MAEETLSANVGTGDLGAAIDQAMGQVPVANESHDEIEEINSTQSDLEMMSSVDDENNTEDPIEDSTQSDEKPDSVGPEIELKVKGFKDLQKVKLDPNDENLKGLLNKGIRFEKVMADTAAKRKALEAKLSEQEDYSEKAEVAQRVARAQALASEGYREEAMAELLGESSEEYINSIVESRIAYQNASPEERLQLDIEKERKSKSLGERRSAEEIEKLKKQIESRADNVQESEYQGHIESAKDRYDLNQWIDDPSEASSLNDMLHSAALNDVIKLQKSRELNNEPNVTQRDIRRAYATRAKVLLNHTKRQSLEMADKKVEEQSKVAEQSAAVASTKNYKQQSSPITKGMSMSDIVDKFRRGGGLI